MSSPPLGVEGQFAPQVLRQYALLADGERGVLVGPHGDFAWMCAPRWDSGAVFDALLGGAGCYGVSPTGRRYVWGGSYEPRTLIWCSRWVTDGGIVECREGLAFPGDRHRAVVLRRISALDRPARLDIVLDPRAEFGRQPARWTRTDDGSWIGRAGPLRLRWRGAPAATPAAHTPSALRTTLSLQPGLSHDLVLEISDQELPDTPVDPDQAWKRTERRWRNEVPHCADTIAPRDSAHTYAVLRGLTSSQGGTVAAATTSLPERAEAGRNYDYRYVWIRDQCYIGQAIAAHGPHPLLDGSVGFVAARLVEHGPRTSPAYTVTGDAIPDEEELPLPGYPGGKAKSGNQVRHQFQLDTFGEALLLLAAAHRNGALDSAYRPAVQVAVDAIAQRWNDPDAGVWELDDQWWAQSRLICAAGLRAAAADLAPRPGQARDWQDLASLITDATTARCRHPSGRWQRSPTDPRVDAALLLPALRGALPPEDPCSTATLHAVREQLSDQGYVYRFRHDDRALPEAEGAFLLCGFLMALATHQRGEHQDALRWFERNRAACGPPGLLTEEYDVVQRQLRANIPQAFVHAIQLEAATRLARPWPGQ